MRKRLLMPIGVCALLLLGLLSGCSFGETPKIKVLILPTFEIGDMKCDFPGEAQFYYEAFLEGGQEYEIAGGFEGHRLYVKDGVALYVTGMGKVNSALSTMAVLSDRRFDFSNAYVLSTGCAGGAYEYAVMGDVFLVTAAADYDLGHHADIRDMKDQSAATWFHDDSFDNSSILKPNAGLMDRAYALVKDVKVETTEKTRKAMNDIFKGAEWACRDPMVLRGATVTGDNYWKGLHDHQNAMLIAATYGCPDPFAVSDMESLAIGLALRRMNMADRYIILRDVVNMDVFMMGATPESLWGPKANDHLSEDGSMESIDIFATAMKNNFAVGRVIVEAILNDWRE